MKKTQTLILAFIIFSILTSSCSKELLVTNGAIDHKPLIFNGEYKTSNLQEIEVQGSAFCGIPSFTKNNKNNHKKALIVTFNGIPLAKTPRILPIMTLVGYSFLSQAMVQYAFGRKTETIGNKKYKTDEFRLGYVPSYILGLPMAGMLNNFTWNYSCLSGATSTLRYRLASENPNVDVFFYPKYDIKKKNVFSDGGVNLRYLFFQDATIKARVSGATLIHK